MKNLYILSTEKESRLFYHKTLKKTILTNKIIVRNIDNVFNQHVYITSDEEPKLDEWGVNIANNVLFKGAGFSSDKYSKENFKKIILTTDQYLIKDGVQTITDKVLEWFVKNQNCEIIDVESEIKCYDEHGLCISMATEVGDYTKLMYYCIIPEEELQKNFYCGEEVDYGDKCDFQCEGCNDATGVDYGFISKEKPKEELEILEVPISFHKQEKMYTEEDMFEYANYTWEILRCHVSVKRLSPEEWFEQVKKK